MSEPLAWLNGTYLPWSQACLPVSDMGLVHGASITEMTRSFGQRWFRLEEHLDRLQHSIDVVGWKIDLQRVAWRTIAEHLLKTNAAMLPAGHELGLIQFVTAGPNMTYLGASTKRQPTVCVHTFPLPAELWAERYQTGQSLWTPSVRALPTAVIDPTIKHRSRLHWILAEAEVRQHDPHGTAILCDDQGRLTETSAGNFFVVREGNLFTPPAKIVLPGISRQVIFELASQLGLRCEEADLFPEDVFSAQEAFTTSTPYALLPVCRFNGQPVGNGLPGATVRRLWQAWGSLAGVDVVDQMQRIARERKEADRRLH